MLITQLKPIDDIRALLGGKTVVIVCEGCKEVYFPEIEAETVYTELSVNGTDMTVMVTDLTAIVTDYICNLDNLEPHLQKHMGKINSADTLLVFSCGVGVQTVAERFEGKSVFAACDTLPLPGCQGVTPLEYDCAQCGECHMNDTGGICPITACSKSLVNGQCGGSKNGMCEVDKDMECGWERIYRRLEKLELLDAMQHPAKLRNFGSTAGP